MRKRVALILTISVMVLSGIKPDTIYSNEQPGSRCIPYGKKYRITY